MRLDEGASAMRYRIYGLTLASDTLLPELTPVTDAEPEADADIWARLSERHAGFPSPARWLMSLTLPTGELWLSCANVEGGYLLRFPECADFFVDADGRKIACVPGPETPPWTLRHLLL